MNSNKVKNIDYISEISSNILSLTKSEEIEKLLSELLSESELSVLSKRWRILKMLSQGVTQREIAKELQVSLCKVTRGAKILKSKDAIVTKFLIKEN